MFDSLEAAQEAIRKGERARILMEILLSEIGCTFDQSHHDVWKKLKETQDDYNNACKALASLVHREKQEKETHGVS